MDAEFDQFSEDDDLDSLARDWPDWEALERARFARPRSGVVRPRRAAYVTRWHKLYGDDVPWLYVDPSVVTLWADPKYL